MIYFPEVIVWRVAMAMTEHVISMVLSGTYKKPTAIRARKLMEELCNFIDSSVTLSPTSIKKKVTACCRGNKTGPKVFV